MVNKLYFGNVHTNQIFQFILPVRTWKTIHGLDENKNVSVMTTKPNLMFIFSFKKEKLGFTSKFI